MSNRIRDKIASTSDERSETVPVPEWGVDIEVRSYSLGTRNAIATASQSEGRLDLSLFNARVLIETCFDPEDGAKVFGPGDVEFINSRSAGIADRLASAAHRLSGVTNKDGKVDMGGAMEEAGKDSSSTLSDAPGS